jgi:hypothetical protein
MTSPAPATRMLQPDEAALLDQIRSEAAEIDGLTRRLAEARARRNQLVQRALAAGFSAREIERVAGVSNVRISQLALRAEDRRDADSRSQDPI